MMQHVETLATHMQPFAPKKDVILQRFLACAYAHKGWNVKKCCVGECATVQNETDHRSFKDNSHTNIFIGEFRKTAAMKKQ